MSTFTNRLTTGALVTLAGLHVAWGSGWAFPFRQRETLADAVVGTQVVPPRAACFAVAAALAVGGALVHGVPSLPVALRQVGLLGMAGVFGMRGALGLAGKTDLLAPGSTSTRFRRLDRRLYAPLCVALAAGSLAARC